MKVLSVLPAVMASALLVPQPVQAEECSASDLDIYTKMAADIAAQQACAALLKGNGVTTLDAAALAALNPCNDQPCLAYYEKFASELKDCTVRGFPLRQPFDALIAACKGVTGESPLGPVGAPVTMTPPLPVAITNPNPTATPTETPVATKTSSRAPAHTMAATLALVGLILVVLSVV